VDDLWWGGLGCVSGHQQGDQQTQRCRGEPTGYRPHRHGPSTVARRPAERRSSSGSCRVGTPEHHRRQGPTARLLLAGKGSGPAGGNTWRPFGPCGWSLPLPLRWLGPTTSLGASVGRTSEVASSRGCGWPQFLTSIGVLRSRGSSQPHPCNAQGQGRRDPAGGSQDRQRAAPGSRSARGAAAEPVSQRAAGPARSSMPPSVGSGPSVSWSGASATRCRSGAAAGGGGWRSCGALPDPLDLLMSRFTASVGPLEQPPRNRTRPAR